MCALAHTAAREVGASASITLGPAHPATATAIAASVASSPCDHGWRARISGNATCAPRRRPNITISTTHMTASIASPMGRPICIHVPKSRSTPRLRSSAMPMRLGGVPTGVPSPPIDAPHAIASTIADWKRRSAEASAASATGSTIAVEAVFDMSSDSANAVPDSATSSDAGPRASPTVAAAARAPRPCTFIASAMKNAPTNMNRSGEPNAPNACLGVARPPSTERAATMSATAADGSASLSHHVTASAMRPASSGAGPSRVMT